MKTTYICSGCGRESIDLIEVNKVKDTITERIDNYQIIIDRKYQQKEIAHFCILELEKVLKLLFGD